MSSLYCPRCGAPLNSAKIHCEYCQAEIQKDGGISYGAFITQFGKKMQEAAQVDSTRDAELMSNQDDKSANQRALIDTLHIPAEKDSLVQLTAFVVGQLNSCRTNLSFTNVDRMRPVTTAWVGKANEIKSKLTLMAVMDSQASSAVAMLQTAAEGAEQAATAAGRNGWYLVLAMLGVFAVGAVFVKYVIGN